MIAIVQVLEQTLFGWVVDALAKGEGAFPIIGLWAALGLVGIFASVIVAVAADRMAHRRRLAAMGDAFERAITLPISYHAEKGSGAVVRAILAGTDSLFWNWLSFLREQLTAIVGILFLIPTAIRMDWRMASILGGLAVIYLVLNMMVVSRTSEGQAAVEQYHSNVYGRVGDVLGNVTVVQSYTRLGAEMQAMQDIMGQLLAAQYPVLTWWGLLTVLTRAAATITMVLVFAIGAVLATARRDHGRHHRRLRRLRQSADRQARPALGLLRADQPAGADAAHLFRPDRRQGTCRREGQRPHARRRQG